MIWLTSSELTQCVIFVLHEMPFERDGVISWELMIERMNSDLANILGNLVNRTIFYVQQIFLEES